MKEESTLVKAYAGLDVSVLETHIVYWTKVEIGCFELLFCQSQIRSPKQFDVMRQIANV